jgi:hypothetical protein
MVQSQLRCTSEETAAYEIGCEIDEETYEPAETVKKRAPGPGYRSPILLQF